MKKFNQIILTICLFITLVNTSSFCQTKTDRSVYVYDFKGNVKVIPNGSNIGMTCRKGMDIYPADWIKTGPESEITLAFDKNADNVIRVGENSLLILKMDGYIKVQLLKGEVYAILENVNKDDTFRMLTPSVVTESKTSAWGVNNEGLYTSVMVLDGQAYVCGINKDGTVKKEKYKIGPGFQRNTKRFDDPGKLDAIPNDVVKWFKDEVVKHHMSKELTKHMKTKDTRTREGKKEQITQRKLKGKNITIIDDEEVDILEYIYKSHLSNSQTINNETPKTVEEEEKETDEILQEDPSSKETL